MSFNLHAKFTYKKMPLILTVEMSPKWVKKKKKHPRTWVYQLSLFYKPIKKNLKKLKREREMETCKFARVGV